MILKRLLLAGFALCCAAPTLFAQEWVEPWINNQGNFYTIRDAYNREQQEEKRLSFFRKLRLKGKKEQEEKEGAWLHYKRWEWFMEPRVFPSGDLSLPSSANERFNEYLQQNPLARQQAAGMRSSQPANWSFVGPTGAPAGGGAGRINAVRVDPNNTDIIWACAPAGGLWRTSDGGITWTNNNDFLSVIGCSDVAIDHTNSQIMYLATGDGDAGDTYSIGVLKSIDGGISWNTTGLVWLPSQVRRIYKLLIDPNNTAVVYAGTNSGIFKTTDGGISWNIISSSLAYDIEFQPGNPNRIYACGTKFLRSDDAGISWVQVSAGLPTVAQVTRLAIAVTQANHNYVYVLAGAANSYAYYGMYRSTDNANSFVPMSNSPNLMGWDPDGDDSGGQAWYTLSVAASNSNANEVVTGGVNIWKSYDEGQSWLLSGHWYGGGGAPYVHADIHDLYYVDGSGSVLLAGTDGGVFVSNDGGGSWNDISGNMGIAQIYRIGLSASDYGMLITGHQDNGTNLKNGSSYDEVLGGDGMDCFIDWSDNNVMYGELYYGDFHRSTNGGQNWQSINSGLPTGAWITPWTQDPADPNTIYAGFSDVYKSTDRGDNWTQLGGFPGGGDINWVKVARSNTQCIYASTSSTIGRSSDGGQNWTNITAGLPTSQGAITRFDVSSYDENKIWVTFSGYTAGAKVYFTADGGQSWVNWSTGLPNLPANCVVAVPGSSSDAVFVGCDVGVYYRDNNSNGWIPYFAGLPHTVVSDLEIFVPTMTLRAATYGRGVWECPIDTTLLAPLAGFTANTQAACPGQSISFTDLSTCQPTAWSWSLPGATPATSNAQHPVVSYAQPGVYPVSLVASNANGADTESKTAWITIGGNNTLPMAQGFAATAFPPAGWTEVNNAPASAFWEHSNSIGHNSTNSTYFDNFNQSLNGATDDLRTPMYSLVGFSGVNLSFDVAYSRYSSSRSDTLEVLISTDCGQSFTPVYSKGGTTLATVPDQTSAFSPTNSQWRTETVSLNAFANSPSVMVAFRNHGRHGQFLYLDNILITGTASAAPSAAFSFSPAAICAGAPVFFSDASSPFPDNWSWTFNGADTLTGSSPVTGPRSWNSPGTYTVTLVTGNSLGSDTVSQTITVLPNPVADAGSDTTFCPGSSLLLPGSGGGTYSWAPLAAVSHPNIANPAVTLNASAAATLTVTDQNGCSGSDTINITVLASPAFIISAPAIVCPGDTTLLVCSDSTYSYSWVSLPTIYPLNNDTAWVSPFSNTIYIVTATDSNGCASTISRTISTFPPVNAPTITVNGNVLTSSYTNGNQWYYFGVAIPGATGQSYTATQQGSYSVVYTTVNGCSSEASLSTIVSVGDPAPGLPFMSVNPNPNNGSFTVELLPAAGETLAVRITDLLGRDLLSKNVSGSGGPVRLDFDLAPEGKGVYFVQVSNGQGASVQKVLVH